MKEYIEKHKKPSGKKLEELEKRIVILERAIQTLSFDGEINVLIPNAMGMGYRGKITWCALCNSWNRDNHWHNTASIKVSKNNELS